MPRKSFALLINVFFLLFFTDWIFFNTKQAKTKCIFAMAPDVLSIFLFERNFIPSRSMHPLRHAIIETFILDLFYLYLLPCYRRSLLLLLSSRCSSSSLICLNTEQIVFWSLLISLCGYLLLSHILILLCVILIVYQVFIHIHTYIHMFVIYLMVLEFIYKSKSFFLISENRIMMFELLSIHEEIRRVYYKSQEIILFFSAIFNLTRLI